MQLEYASIVGSPWQRRDIKKLEKSTEELKDLLLITFIILAVYQV